MYNLAGKEVLNEHARMHSAYSCLSPHIHRINLEFPLYRGFNKKVLVNKVADIKIYLLNRMNMRHLHPHKIKKNMKSGLIQ